jgi:hypothetical protein
MPRSFGPRMASSTTPCSYIQTDTIMQTDDSLTPECAGSIKPSMAAQTIRSDKNISGSINTDR